MVVVVVVCGGGVCVCGVCGVCDGDSVMGTGT